MKHSISIDLNGLQVNEAFLRDLSSTISRHSKGKPMNLRIGELDLKYGAGFWNADIISGTLTLALDLTDV